MYRASEKYKLFIREVLYYNIQELMSCTLSHLLDLENQKRQRAFARKARGILNFINPSLKWHTLLK